MLPLALLQLPLQLLLLLSAALMQLAAAVPQQTGTPTFTQTPTQSLPLSPSRSQSWSSPPGSASGSAFSSVSDPFPSLQIFPVSRTWPAPLTAAEDPVPTMNPPYAARVVVQFNSKSVFNMADSSNYLQVAVARWTEDYNDFKSTDGYRPPKDYTPLYLMNGNSNGNGSGSDSGAKGTSNGTAAAQGMTGLAGINVTESTTDTYRAVRSAMAFAVSKKFRSLILYPNKSATNAFDIEPLPPSVPLGHDETPNPPNEKPKPPLSPRGASTSGFSSSYFLYPIFSHQTQRDEITLFRMAFDDSPPDNLSVIILDHGIGQKLHSFISGYQKPSAAVASSWPFGESIKVAVQTGPILTSKDASQSYSTASRLDVWVLLLIAFICAALFSVTGWILFKRYALGYWSLTKEEEGVITVAVQLALELWYRESAERRANAVARLPKPVKPNMNDIDMVTLNRQNRYRILSHSSESGAVATTTAATAATTAFMKEDLLASSSCCSICIEEYNFGDSVRVLPICRHVFHATCVDHWLLTTSALCPLCKLDTRTSTELFEYESSLAAANAAIADASAAESDNINNGVGEIFNQIVDRVCQEQLGRTIERIRPLRVMVLEQHTRAGTVEFITRVFIRNTDDSEDLKSWWAQTLYGLRKRHQNPEDLYIVAQSIWTLPNNQTRQTVYPPSQQPPPPPYSSN
ncbi:hypothetical protein GQ42DRAFT_178217 [Ramicandelaber brevisporus]|nr:hypothetical protein GQ42DRAFT_178217 [Ramicandelaber brevisporus]